MKGGEDMITIIREMAKAGFSYSEIAKALGIPVCVVRHIG